MVRRCPWLGSPGHSTLYLHWTVSGESGGEARKKDRPVSRNRKARFLRGGQVKRERWPLSGRQCTHVRRGTIPPLRAIEAEEGSDGDFGTLPFLNCPIPFPGRENDASLFSSRGQKLEGTISLLVLVEMLSARARTHTNAWNGGESERGGKGGPRRTASFLLLFPDVLQWKRLDEARLLQREQPALSTARELQKRGVGLRPLSRPREFRGRSGYDVRAQSSEKLERVGKMNGEK